MDIFFFVIMYMYSLEVILASFFVLSFGILQIYIMNIRK